MLTQYGAKPHFKRAVKHLFERGEAGTLTIGPRVPLLKHLNVAKEILIGDEVSSRAFERLKLKWAYNSDLVWNTFAAPGSDEAKLPKTDRTRTSASSPTAAIKY